MKTLIGVLMLVAMCGTAAAEEKSKNLRFEVDPSTGFSFPEKTVQAVQVLGTGEATMWILDKAP
jgi:hypothetical protein